MSRRDMFAHLLAVWNGEAALDDIDSLVTASYRGHLGSRERDLVALKEDIAAYRQRVLGVRFKVEHQFGDGDYLATRLTAVAGGQTIAGVNISRWEHDLLAEEWAVWETFDG